MYPLVAARGQREALHQAENSAISPKSTRSFYTVLTECYIAVSFHFELQRYFAILLMKCVHCIPAMHLRSTYGHTLRIKEGLNRGGGSPIDTASCDVMFWFQV